MSEIVRRRKTLETGLEAGLDSEFTNKAGMSFRIKEKLSESALFPFTGER